MGITRRLRRYKPSKGFQIPEDSKLPLRAYFEIAHMLFTHPFIFFRGLRYNCRAALNRFYSELFIVHFGIHEEKDANKDNT